MISGKKNITVLTIVNSLNLGGIEKTLLGCIPYLKSNDIQIVVCCFTKGGKLLTSFTDLGVKVLRIKKTGLIFLDFIQLAFLLFRNKIDVVHSRLGYTSGGFVAAAKIFEKKSVVSFHSSYPSALSRFKKRKLVFFLLRIHLKIHKFIVKGLSDKIVGHSQANLDANFLSWKEDFKFEIIYNGIDFDKLDKQRSNPVVLNKFIDKNSFILLHVGSMRPEKNHLFMIDCLQWLNKDNAHYKLIMVGDGDLLSSIKEYAKKLGLDENVYFTGHQIDIKQYYQIADLFFFPSINEGFGNVIAEAQYMNLPVCCSNIRPLLESSFIGYHKFMFNPHEVSEAGKSILEMEYNREEIEKNIAPQAHDYVINHFSLSNMVYSLTTMYKSFFVCNLQDE